MIDTKSILSRLRHIEIRTRRLVDTSFAGQYHSVFKGRGMNFEEVREYVPGDDTRSIDWNVTARMDKPFVKKFTEERELTVMLAVDVSASGNYGSVHSSKRELAAEVAAILAFSAVKNNDKVGLLLFTDQPELIIPPRKGRQHTLRLIRDMLYYEPVRKKTDLSNALTLLNRLLTRRAVVFLISDFLDQHFEKTLAVASRKHDLIAIEICDPGEFELPEVGLVTLEDAETGRQIEFDTSSLAARNAFAALEERRRSELHRLFQKRNIDCIVLRTDRDCLPPLRSFFLTRERRLAP
ncbi:MAG: DUF58 domain-containing protein [Chthoniobacterales bacterium]|nr:DUF58 domain-containing protein [Chthoniobacterales bacterium]